MAVRQASVAEISSLAASRAVVLTPVPLWVKYWKSDSGASSLQTLPTIMLMTAKVPSAQHSEVRALLWSVLPWKALRPVRLSRVSCPACHHSTGTRGLTLPKHLYPGIQRVFPSHLLPRASNYSTASYLGPSDGCRQGRGMLAGGRRRSRAH